MTLIDAIATGSEMHSHRDRQSEKRESEKRERELSSLPLLMREIRERTKRERDFSSPLLSS